MRRNFLLERDYENGYRQALIDVRNYIDGHSVGLKALRLSNCKGICSLLQAIHDNADVFMEHKEDVCFCVKDGKNVVFSGFDSSI